MTLIAADTPPQINVVIPIFKDDAALARLLTQLARLDVALIYIIDGEGRPNAPKNIAPKPLSLADKITWLPAPRGRGVQIAQGLDMAINNPNCQAIWVLHADSSPDAKAPNDIRQILSTPDTALGMFRLNFGAPRTGYRLFEYFARFDSALTSFGDQGFFFRRDDLAALWPQLKQALIQAPILEDMLIRRALKSRGRVKKSRLKIGSSPRRFERYGLWRTQYRNIMILWRAHLGASPAQLYQSYYNPPLTQRAPRTPALGESLDAAHITSIRT
jgi:hypothetical protein